MFFTLLSHVLPLQGFMRVEKGCNSTSDAPYNMFYCSPVVPLL
jgi:hypothetical protein